MDPQASDALQSVHSASVWRYSVCGTSTCAASST
eukprot:CAMPEP_0179426144 /NCGR_PEP_ID=MMETSP0799-20121207/12571_1 /TAXON_ID=46947 /ORGANISM="Geminigera cryophila, Strain CCMP2564" /LENGTH=33 /DNA_ID= /DNA_START= /DNA_END= /DNA_ORIENTATION=